MADTKISNLPELTSPTGVDLLPIVDDPAGTPVTKKVTLTNIIAYLAALAVTFTNKTFGDDLDMDGNSIINLVDPTSDQEAATKKYVDDNSGAGGVSFWNDVPGTPTRVSDTQFTITDTGNANLYDLIFKKGVIIKWSESGTFQTAMVISSSYSTNVVTINVVGDSITAGFTSMKYALAMMIKETFIVPGNLSTGTDVSKTFYASMGIYIISADAYVKVAGTTNSSVFDINDDGSTKFTTKPTIATGTLSDIDNVADSPSTEVAAGSLITIDIDSLSTTVPQELYIDVFYYPSSWRYRS